MDALDGIFEVSLAEEEPSFEATIAAAHSLDGAAGGLAQATAAFAKPSGAMKNLRCVKKTTIRAGAEMDSVKVGTLSKGSVITPQRRQTIENGECSHSTFSQRSSRGGTTGRSEAGAHLADTCGAVFFLFVLHAGVTRVRFLNGWVSASTFEGLVILEEYAAPPVYSIVPACLPACSAFCRRPETLPARLC
eukprot:COSAG01_NODE_9624_length_2386_cov_2.383035_1_plen_191_part_00